MDWFAGTTSILGTALVNTGELAGSDHCWVRLTLPLPLHLELGWRTLQPAPVPGGEVTGWPISIAQALGHQAIDDRWASWTRRAEQCLRVCPSRVSAPRGFPPRRVRRTPCAPQGPPAWGATTRQHRRLLVVGQRLRALQHLPGDAPRRFKILWWLQRQGWGQGTSLEEAYDEVQRQIRLCECRAAARFRKRWHEWTAEMHKARPAFLYKWLRRTKHVQDRLAAGSGSNPTDLGRRLEQAADAWGAIWQEHPRACSPLPGAGSPPPLPPLTTEELALVLRHAPDKARGPDGWLPSELRKLPAPAIAELVDLLNHFEASRSWPEALLTVSVVLLPKPHQASEADMRPIGLLPMIYRLWVAARQSALRDRQRRLFPDGCIGALELSWALGL